MKATAVFWKQKFEDTHRYTVQISIPKALKGVTEIKNVFRKWLNSGIGHDPKTEERIILYIKDFSSQKEWTQFRKSEKLDKILEMKEIK